MPTPEQYQTNEETKNAAPHPLENVISFEAHMEKMNQEKPKDPLVEIMGQHFNLEEPYQPHKFSEEEIKQFFPKLGPKDPLNDWIKSWQDPRQAFGFLQYAGDDVRDYIFALHKDLIYEDDEGKPHMRPTIDIDGKVYAAKEQPMNNQGNAGPKIMEFPSEQANAL